MGFFEYVSKNILSLVLVLIIAVIITVIFF